MVEKARSILNQVFFNFKLNSWRKKPIRSSGRLLELKSKIGETTLFELKSLNPRQMKLPILTCIMHGDFLPELKPLLRAQKLSCGNNLLDCTAGQYATYCFLLVAKLLHLGKRISDRTVKRIRQSGWWFFAFFGFSQCPPLTELSPYAGQQN